MVWKNLVSQLAITSQRKVLSAAIVYAISVLVHFTSPVGDATGIPAHSVRTTSPLELRNAIHVGHSTGRHDAGTSAQIKSQE
jgi:hypothetical protein